MLYVFFFYTEAKGETSSQLQSEISSDGQENAISINTAQPESIIVAPGDPPKNSLVSCDSQALNMLADLALSAAASPTPSSEPRNLPCPSGLPPSEVLPSKQYSSHGTSDHEYHRGAKSQKGGRYLSPLLIRVIHRRTPLSTRKKAAWFLPLRPLLAPTWLFLRKHWKGLMQARALLLLWNIPMPYFLQNIQRSIYSRE